MKFAPEYVTHVLNENFGDAQAMFLPALMAIHRAHLVMLAACGIVSGPDTRTLRAALDSVSLDTVRKVSYDGTCEDLFFYIDGLLAKACGSDVAGRLHTARSRNDIDMTMYRMRLRELLLDLWGATIDLRAAFIGVAELHRETLLAAHTHTQPAQPTTLAHYFLGVIEQLERDGARLHASYQRTNRCPLGACAITGTGFPIDRGLTSDLLGFEAPTGNTYGSIATVDYLLESVSAAGVMMVGLGRVLQDLLLWSTSEFGYLRVGEGYVQTSSIMPQKRNPVALEHARAISSKAAAQGTAILFTVHNTPFGDVVDTEDDLQPLVHSTFRDAIRATRLVAAVMRTAEFDAARLTERVAEGWITLTELADTLTRDHGLPFKTSHAIAARLAAELNRDTNAPLANALARASSEMAGLTVRYDEAALRSILSPSHFVRVRRTHGGPAPDESSRALQEARASLLGDERTWNAAVDALKAADLRLADRVAKL